MLVAYFIMKSILSEILLIGDKLNLRSRKSFQKSLVKTLISAYRPKLRKAIFLIYISIFIFTFISGFEQDIFALEIFSKQVWQLESGDEVPVALNYRLCPGDKLKVYIPESKSTFIFEIDQSGYVTLPNSSQVFLMGLDFKKAESTLRKAMLFEYQHSDIVVSMSSIRLIRVSVYDDPARPDMYKLPNFTTAKEAADYIRSLDNKFLKRRIQIHRKGINLGVVCPEGDTDDRCLKDDFWLSDGDLLQILPPLYPIKITGMVKRPGIYHLANPTSLKEILQESGELKEHSSKVELVLHRAEHKESLHLDLLSPSPINLEGVYEIEIKTLPAPPKPFSSIHILKTIPWLQELFQYQTTSSVNPPETVSVIGEVKSPGTYPLSEINTMAGLISKAGGFTDKAYLRGAVLLRPSLKKQNEHIIDELIQVLQREFFPSGQPSGAERGVPLAFWEKTKFELLKYLRQISPLNRFTINLYPLPILRRSQHDISLRAGDILLVPTRPDVVYVLGCTVSQGPFPFRADWGIKDYVKAAGLRTGAKEDKIYVYKVDGLIVEGNSPFLSWNFKKRRWEMGPYRENVIELEPGDIIVVPSSFKEMGIPFELIEEKTEFTKRLLLYSGVLISHE